MEIIFHRIRQELNYNSRVCVIRYFCLFILTKSWKMRKKFLRILFPQQTKKLVVASSISNFIFHKAPSKRNHKAMKFDNQKKILQTSYTSTHFYNLSSMKFDTKAKLIFFERLELRDYPRWYACSINNNLRQTVLLCL